MPELLNPLNVTVNTGGTITLPTVTSHNIFIFSGTSTLASGYNIVPDSGAVEGMLFSIKWNAQVTYSGGNVVTIFGTALTQVQAVSELTITCYYNGSSWEVDILVDAESLPNNYNGVETTTVPSGGGTVTLLTGVNKVTQHFIGTVTLSSSYTITAGGFPSNGDRFEVVWSAACTLGVNSVTIFGISLDSIQALSGNVTVVATYNGSSWIAELIQGELKTNAVTNPMLAQMPTMTIKGNLTGSTANAADNTILALSQHLNQYSAYTVTSAGGTINISIDDKYIQQVYLNAVGNPSLVNPLAINAVGTPVLGQTVYINFKGSLPWGGSSPQTITIFGNVVQLNLFQKECLIKLFYDGSSWILIPFSLSYNKVHTIHFIASFDVGSNNSFFQIKIPYIGKIKAFRSVVCKDFSGTDNATLEFRTSASYGGGSSPLSGPYTILASTGAGSVVFDIAEYTPSGFDGNGAFWLEVNTVKTTPGGQLYCSMDIEEI